MFSLLDQVTAERNHLRALLEPNRERIAELRDEAIRAANWSRVAGAFTPILMGPHIDTRGDGVRLALIEAANCLDRPE